MASLNRLIYTSARATNCTDQEINNILTACKRNNPKYSVTGVLLHSNRRFLQYIEGEPEELLRLYKVIEADKRHGGVTQRVFEPIKERLFPSWQMAYKNVDDKTLEFNTTLTRDEKVKYKDMIEGKDDFKDGSLTILKTFFKIA